MIRHLTFFCIAICSLACAASPSPSARAQNPPSPQQQTQPLQDQPDQAYLDQRKFAFSLFNANHHLEALPVFEDLAKKNPSDSQVLFGLGASLIDHSATVTDENAARQERIRARNLLLRAKQLGNNNNLLLNLLDMLPPDGSIVHQKNPEVDAAVQAGEAAFAKNDYDEAVKQYSRAFQLEPTNYAAALFIGDAYFAKKDFPSAAQWYERAMQVNPDIETAYRYESDMLTKNGDFAQGRTRAIQAIVAEPYNQVAWRGLLQWATLAHVQLVRVHINTGSDVSGKDGQITITVDPNAKSAAPAVWMGYAGERALWRSEKFKQRFPGEPEYRHSLAEEADSLSLAASLLRDKKPEAIAADPDLSLLKKIADANLIEPYVLLSAADRGIAQDYAAYRKENRARLEEYLSRFVVPEAPANPPPPK